MDIKTPKFGLLFLEKQEGKAKWDAGLGLFVPYQDQVHKWTIGVGHLIRSNEDFSAGIDEAMITTLLSRDVGMCEESIRQLGIDLTLHQIAALVSFSFNVGIGWLQRGGVHNALVAGDFAGAAKHFEDFDVAGGEHRPWLLARRRAEEALFNTPDDASEDDKNNVLKLAQEAGELRATIIKSMGQQFDIRPDPLENRRPSPDPLDS